MFELHSHRNITVLQKQCQENLGKFPEVVESRFGGSERGRYYLKMPK